MLFPVEPKIRSQLCFQYYRSFSLFNRRIFYSPNNARVYLKYSASCSSLLVIHLSEYNFTSTKTYKDITLFFFLFLQFKTSLFRLAVSVYNHIPVTINWLDGSNENEQKRNGKEDRPLIQNGVVLPVNLWNCKGENTEAEKEFHGRLQSCWSVARPCHLFAMIPT